MIEKFQSTPPVKAATSADGYGVFGCTEFQSTPPVKAATVTAQLPPTKFDISIHAAREGGDRYGAASADKVRYFNPRRP